ncbi:MAG: hypothetical protein ACREMR_07170, partial [Gemmatimonadales bacterium]
THVGPGHHRESREAERLLHSLGRPPMRHVLGMAKRHLDLNGAKAPKLELDYLRLVVAVRELRLRGQAAVGYLLVMTPTIKRRTQAWANKYGGVRSLKDVAGFL